MIELRVHDSVLHLEGDLERADVATLERQLPRLLASVSHIDCHDLDIEDGAALASLARLLKDAAATRKLTVHGAPQLLAHTLYRVGALDRFHWPDLRWDEASTQ